MNKVVRKAWRLLVVSAVGSWFLFSSQYVFAQSSDQDQQEVAQQEQTGVSQRQQDEAAERAFEAATVENTEVAGEWESAARLAEAVRDGSLAVLDTITAVADNPVADAIDEVTHAVIDLINDDSGATSPSRCNEENSSSSTPGEIPPAA